MNSGNNLNPIEVVKYYNNFHDSYIKQILLDISNNYKDWVSEIPEYYNLDIIFFHSNFKGNNNRDKDKLIKISLSNISKLNIRLLPEKDPMIFEVTINESNDLYNFQVDDKIQIICEEIKIEEI